MKVPRETIRDYLTKKNISVSHNGFVYLLCVLEEVFKNDLEVNWKICSLYEITAQKYNTNWQAIEKSIRYSLAKANIPLTTKEFCIRAYYYFKYL